MLKQRYLLMLLVLAAAAWVTYLQYRSVFWSRVCITWSNARTTQREILFFNRVPKTGSEMTVLLLQWLQGINNFRHVRLKNFVERRLTPSEEKVMWDEVIQLSAETPNISVAFDRHVYFSDAQHLTGEKMSPVYFSVVRDPIEKFVSRFYYDRATPKPGLKFPANITLGPRKKFDNVEDCIQAQDPECVFLTGKHYDLSIPYFCGNAEHCTELNNQKALDEAVVNVDKYYPVVGVLEDVNCTLKLLERKIPAFFSNVQEIYFHELLEPKKNKNVHRPRTLRDDLREVLRQNLSTEYKFYDMMRQKLNEQCKEL